MRSLVAIKCLNYIYCPNNQHGSEFEQVFNGIEVLDEFDVEFLLLQQNM
jgi:hypothetical protein